MLRPVRGQATAYKKQGILVFRTGPLKASVVDETIRKVRRQREREILGTKSRVFFDTSVLVASFLDGHEHYDRSFAVLAGASRKNACCAAHSLAEFYATITRLPGKISLNVDQALASLDSISERLELISLESSEYRHAIRAAASWGISGGTIYDALLGHCALKARVTDIYTWNVDHFRMLGPEIARKVRTP